MREAIAKDQAPPPRLHKHEDFVSRLVDDHHDLLVYLPPCTRPKGNAGSLFCTCRMGKTSLIRENLIHQGNLLAHGGNRGCAGGGRRNHPLIIVGIYNAGVKRVDEYTPVEDKRLGGGHADVYGRMLVEELKPFIDDALPNAARVRITAEWGAPR